MLRQGEVLHCPDSTRNPIELKIPRLIWEEGGVLSVPGEGSSAGSETHWLQNMMSIWSSDWLNESLAESSEWESSLVCFNPAPAELLPGSLLDSTFSALPLFGMSPSEVHRRVKRASLQNLILDAADDLEDAARRPYLIDPDFAACTSTPTTIDPRVTLLPLGDLAGDELGLPHLANIGQAAWRDSYLSRRDAHFVLPSVVAPPISSSSTSTSYMNHQASLLAEPSSSLALFGLSPTEREDAVACEHLLPPGVPPQGLLAVSAQDQLPQPSMQMPEMKRLIFDSAKLARLDLLLRELKAGGHRVLLYFQMTKMIDLIEEYLYVAAITLWSD